MKRALRPAFNTTAHRTWHRPQYDTWQHSRSDEERALEQQQLQNLFSKAERSPTAMAALAWARAHDVVFAIIDDPESKFAGYMLPGCGVVVIDARNINGKWGALYDVGTLVHEIRHVWQDYYGLLTHLDGTATARLGLRQNLLREALYEADADAHGRLARREMLGGTLSDDKKRKLMRGYFLAWPQRRSAGYVARALSRHARIWKLEPLTTDDKAAQARAVAPERPKLKPISPMDGGRAGIDPDRREEIEKLGRSFTCGNYLSGFDARSLPRLFTDVGAKLARHLAERPKDAAMVTAVRKREMKWRQKNFPLKRLPLPRLRL